MVKFKLEDYLILPSTSIRTVMKKFNSSGIPIGVVVDINRNLLGFVTDGDVRRYLVNNKSLDASIVEISTKKPYTVNWKNRSNVKHILKEKSIKAIPLVNDLNQVDGLFFDNQNPVFYKNSFKVPVVINAGGKGTRLYPYTKVLPKPLIPIGDNTILELIIDRFCNVGCESFFTIVNHKKEIIKSYFKELDYNYNINFIDEEKPLGTGGGLYLLKDKIDQPFFFTNCDTIIDADYRDIYMQHIKSNNMVTIICAEKKEVIPYGIVKEKEDGSLDVFSEKPSYDFVINTGFYLVNPFIFNYIQESETIGFPDIIQRCMKDSHRIGIYKVASNSWLDMGQINELEQMQEVLG